MRDHFVTLRNVARIGRVHLTAGLAAAALCGGLLPQAAVAADNTTWGGFGWGLGVAADFDLIGTRITSAQIVNNNNNPIVRVIDSSANVGLSFVLEAHYFFTNWGFPAMRGACGTPIDASNCNKVGIGPFVAIEVGGATGSTTVNTNTPITAFAMGAMVGLHHPKIDSKTHLEDPTDHSSWNFGIGFRVDPKAQVLGDGFYPNQPPPAGETAIRTKTEPRYGLMLLSSFSF